MLQVFEIRLEEFSELGDNIFAISFGSTIIIKQHHPTFPSQQISEESIIFFSAFTSYDTVH